MSFSYSVSLERGAKRLLINFRCCFSVARAEDGRGVCFDKQGVDLELRLEGVLRVSYRAAAKEPRERTDGTERCGT